MVKLSVGAAWQWQSVAVATDGDEGLVGIGVLLSQGSEGHGDGHV